MLPFSGGLTSFPNGLADQNNSQTWNRIDPRGRESAAVLTRILIGDADKRARDTFTAVLEEAGHEVCCAASGAEVVACLRRAPYDILLCDMFLPGPNGLELLPQVQALAPDMSVIFTAAQGNAAMARTALESGASDFITKTGHAGELPIIIERNLTRRAVLRQSAAQHRHALLTSREAVLDALLTVLNRRGTDAEGHSDRVTAYTIELADRMGLPETELYPIERGALLHDIGKIGVPDSVLLKPGKLTTDEWADLRKHPLIGYDLCARIDILAGAAQIVLHHHEAWDGSGYPHGLKADSIPLGARIFAVADTLDAMTSHRPYRKAQSFQTACDEIRRCSGQQFDPAIVQVFLSVPEARWQHLRAQIAPEP